MAPQRDPDLVVGRRRLEAELGQVEVEPPPGAPMRPTRVSRSSTANSRGEVAICAWSRSGFGVRGPELDAVRVVAEGVGPRRPEAAAGPRRTRL